MEEADDAPNVTKTITRYDAASGLQLAMPAGWEATFDGLLGDIEARLTTCGS